MINIVNEISNLTLSDCNPPARIPAVVASTAYNVNPELTFEGFGSDHIIPVNPTRWSVLSVAGRVRDHKYFPVLVGVRRMIGVSGFVAIITFSLACSIQYKLPLSGEFSCLSITQLFTGCCKEKKS
jgi:hypothetical protein